MQKAADAKSQAEKELNSAKDALVQAEKELNAVKEELQNVKDAAAAEQSKDTADQTGEAEKKDTNSTITQKLQQLEEAVQEKQNTYDTIQAKVTEKQAALDSASVALEEKQEQLESNTSTAEDAKKAAERAVEDAGLSADIDHTQEINAISLEQFQKQLEKLKTLKQQNGEITAPSSGIITKVCVETGQKTTDTAMSRVDFFLLRQRTAKTGNISQWEIMQRLPVSVRERLIAALFPWKHRKTEAA